GRICFDDCESEHDWADEDIKLLSMLAQVIGAGITRERFRRQAQQREQLLQAVTTCAAQIGTAPDLRQAITNSLSILAQAVDVDRMLLMEVCSGNRDAGVPRTLLRNFWHAPETPLRLAHIAQTTSLAPDPDLAAWMAPLAIGVTSGSTCVATSAFGAAPRLMYCASWPISSVRPLRANATWPNSPGPTPSSRAVRRFSIACAESRRCR